MDYFIICSAAFITAALTLFSGFGLGTLLMPVFALFFPLELAVALTAVVHLLNNVLKLGLFAKFTDRSVLFHFGLPAVFAALLGARLLLKLSGMTPVFEYTLFSHALSATPVKLIIAILIMAFVIFELPFFQKITFDKRWLPWGGLLSGFFGGLSGHQGALRSAFLVKCGLTKESFIGTGVVIACLVDISRLSVYSVHFKSIDVNRHIWILAAATLSAFAGTFIANRLLKKITIGFIQIVIAVLLFAIAIALGTGVL